MRKKEKQHTATYKIELRKLSTFIYYTGIGYPFFYETNIQDKHS